MRSRIAASVVDLPLPVGPVTRMRPRSAAKSPATAAGRSSSSVVGTRDGISRNTAAEPALLPEQVDAEPRLLSHLVGEVHVAGRQEALPQSRAA